MSPFLVSGITFDAYRDSYHYCSSLLFVHLVCSKFKARDTAQVHLQGCYILCALSTPCVHGVRVAAYLELHHALNLKSFKVNPFVFVASDAIADNNNVTKQYLLPTRGEVGNISSIPASDNH